MEELPHQYETGLVKLVYLKTYLRIEIGTKANQKGSVDDIQK